MRVAACGSTARPTASPIRVLSAADGERIVRLVAHHVGAEVHPRGPRVSAELPETGERFEVMHCSSHRLLFDHLVGGASE